jgi:hypothetical protein
MESHIRNLSSSSVNNHAGLPRQNLNASGQFRHVTHDASMGIPQVPNAADAFPASAGSGHSPDAMNIRFTHAPPNASDSIPENLDAGYQGAPEFTALIRRIRNGDTGTVSFFNSNPRKAPMEELKDKLCGMHNGTEIIDQEGLKRDTEYALVALRRVLVNDIDATNRQPTVNLPAQRFDFDTRMMRLFCRFLAPEIAPGNNMTPPRRVADSNLAGENPQSIVGEKVRMDILMPLLMASLHIDKGAVKLLCKMALANFRDDRKISDRSDRLKLMGALLHAIQVNKRCKRTISLPAEDQALVAHMEKQWLASPPPGLSHFLGINTRTRNPNPLTLPEFAELPNQGARPDLMYGVKLQLEAAQPQNQVSGAGSDAGENSERLEKLVKLLNMAPPSANLREYARAERENVLIGLRRMLVSDSAANDPSTKLNVLNIPFEHQMMRLQVCHLAPKATHAIKHVSAPQYVSTLDDTGNPQEIMSEEARMEIILPLLKVSDQLDIETARMLIKIALENYRDGRKIGHVPERFMLLGAMLYAAGRNLRERGESNGIAVDDDRKKLVCMAEECAASLLILQQGGYLAQDGAEGLVMLHEGLAMLREGAETLKDALPQGRERHVMEMLAREADVAIASLPKSPQNPA